MEKIREYLESELGESYGVDFAMKYIEGRRQVGEPAGMPTAQAFVREIRLCQRELVKRYEGLDLRNGKIVFLS